MLNQRTFNEKANYCEIMQIQHIFCGRLSPVSLLMFGVPQGSVLRPLLYVLYTAELDYVVACHQIPYTCMPTTVKSASARQSSMSLFCSIDLLLVCTTLTTGWRWADALKTQVMWPTTSATQHTTRQHPVNLRWCWHCLWLGSDNRQPTVTLSSTKLLHSAAQVTFSCDNSARSSAHWQWKQLRR